MRKRHVILALVLLFLADAAYSFLQHYSYQVDGDLPKIVLPREDYAQVLENPFGYDAIVKGEAYKATNRFFCHWSMAEYFRSVPFWLQKIASPIESIYLSNALFKTGVQVAMIFAIAFIAIPKGQLFKKNFWLAVLVVTPFFQTADRFSGHLRIIDTSITYAFFYAFPMCLLLLFSIPFKIGIEKASLITLTSLLALMAIIAFSGPLMSPTVLLGGSVMLLFYWYTQGHQVNFSGLVTFVKRNPKLLLVMGVFGALSLYSFYLGSFNAEGFSQNNSTPLIERYRRLPIGILHLLTDKPLYSILVAVVITNFIIIKRKFPSAEGKRINLLLGFIVGFCLLYIALVPLGGYRLYREYIVRWDTIMPVTVALLIYVASSSVFLLSNVKISLSSKYVVWLSAVLMFLTLADLPNFHRNKSEKESLRILAQSTQQVTTLEGNHTVLSWRKTTDPEESRIQARILHMWGVTDEVRLFVQE